LSPASTPTPAARHHVNPFQTIERKDVGLTLKVKPQISENGTVKHARSSRKSLGAGLQPRAPANAGPITNKRSIESNVLVEDGCIIVLGGLIEDTYAGNQDKVPVLGDIPGSGSLFRSETRSRSKTNLMVFLRPVVVRDAVGHADALQRPLRADAQHAARTRNRSPADDADQ